MRALYRAMLDRADTYDANLLSSLNSPKGKMTYRAYDLKGNTDPFDVLPSLKISDVIEELNLSYTSET